MPRSVVITFDASEMPAGKATADHPGMAVRMYVADDILDDGLDVHYEVINGSKSTIEELVAAAGALFSATFRVTQDRPNIWRATARYFDVGPIAQHDVWGEILRRRTEADRLMQVYEGGLCIVRMDMAPNATAHEADALAEKIRSAATRACSVRVADLGRSLEDWQPLA